MNKYLNNACEAIYNNGGLNTQTILNLRKLQVPAAYRNKDAHNEAKAILEGIGYDCVTMALGSKVYDNSEYENFAIKYITDFCSKNTELSPKFLDDTHLVVCTRLFHLVDASVMLKDKMTYDQIALVSEWIRSIYIPSCKKKLDSVIYKHSNHAAWALLGLGISYKFFGETDNITKLIRDVEKNLKQSTGKQPFLTKIFGKYTSNKDEYWIENIRANMGLYYTYYHTIPLVRLNMLFEENGDNTQNIRETLKAITDQIFSYAKGDDVWKYKQTSIPILKQIQQLIFPSSDSFRELTPGGKSSVLFEMLDTGEYLDWYKNQLPLNQDGAYRHSTIRKELKL